MCAERASASFVSMWSSSAEHATAPPHSTLPAGKGAIDASGPRVFAPFHRSAAVSGGGASVVADEGRVWDLSAGETSAALSLIHI